ncbi:MAG: ABC transporter ATP-binding protein [Ruminococcus sp.]|nr:ABC transporter ATP-binding protein [Ruminococcus sp.]
MIKLVNIRKIYNKGKSNEFEALKNISFSVDDGELIAITGKSGAGKSTLLHILACIDSYESGEYYIDDILIKKLSESKLAEIRNKKIGLVMQDFALIDDFSCLENVLLPIDFSRGKHFNAKERAMNALKSVGMDKMSNKPVNKLSGGQKQRIAIARAIINNPSIILADEPTGALDTKTSAEIMNLFHNLHQNGKTVIIITHDPEISKQCSRIMEISDGMLKS